MVVAADIIPPVITCPSDVTYSTDTGVSTKSGISWTVTATDNVAVGGIACNATSGALTASFGDTYVGCIATDTSANAGLCSFRITVLGM